MGRSVSTPSNLREVFYIDWMGDPEDHYNDEHDVWESLNSGAQRCESCHLKPGDDNYDEDKCFIQPDHPWYWQDQWDWFVEDFRTNVLGQFDSITPADEWIGREDHVVAENNLAQFGISEYMGLAALWVVPKAPSDYWGDPDITGLANHWIDQIWPKVESMYPTRLGLMGRFSNGEAVYQREVSA